jgi:hypothetical protein
VSAVHLDVAVDFAGVLRAVGVVVTRRLDRSSEAVVPIVRLSIKGTLTSGLGAGGQSVGVWELGLSWDRAPYRMKGRARQRAQRP